MTRTAAYICNNDMPINACDRCKKLKTSRLASKEKRSPKGSSPVGVWRGLSFRVLFDL